MRNAVTLAKLDQMEVNIRKMRQEILGGLPTAAGTTASGIRQKKTHDYVDCRSYVQSVAAFTQSERALIVAYFNGKTIVMSENREFFQPTVVTKNGFGRWWHRNYARNQGPRDARTWIAKELTNLLGRPFAHTDLRVIARQNVRTGQVNRKPNLFEAPLDLEVIA